MLDIHFRIRNTKRSGNKDSVISQLSTSRMKMLARLIFMCNKRTTEMLFMCNKLLTEMLSKNIFVKAARCYPDDRRFGVVELNK